MLWPTAQDENKISIPIEALNDNKHNKDDSGSYVSSEEDEYPLLIKFETFVRTEEKINNFPAPRHRPTKSAVEYVKHKLSERYSL